MSESALLLGRRVLVAIPTYRRPDQLTVLLTAVARLTLPSDGDVEVAIFDNDNVPSAESIVAGLIDRLPMPVSYHHSPEPGLSAIRNKAISYACSKFDFVAMIDDDEAPEPNWLVELLRVALRTNADATFGPVHFSVPSGPSRWLDLGGFYNIPTYENEAEVLLGYSGNCLLRTESLRRHGVTFDSAFNLSGGEDMMFFRQLRELGARMVFAAKAIATEAVTSDRLTATFILRLNYRRGNTLALCDARLKSGKSTLIVRALKGCARVTRGVFLLVPRTVFRGRIGALHAACDIAHGLGTLYGLTGSIYEGYARNDARA